MLLYIFSALPLLNEIFAVMFDSHFHEFTTFEMPYTRLNGD